MHLIPFMCGSSGCHVRKGDKHQMKRHRRSRHPREPPLLFREQDQDPVALKQFKALNERNLGYDRVAKICRATTLAELDEPWERAARASSTNPVKSESPPLSALSLPPPPPPPQQQQQQQPAVVATGLGLSPALGLSPDQSPLSGSNRNSITFPDRLPTANSTANGGGTRLMSLDGADAGGDAATSNEFGDVAITDFVNKVLVPTVDKMHMQSAPQPSRASRDELLERFMRHLMSTAQMGLDLLERRRSTGECHSRRRLHLLQLLFLVLTPVGRPSLQLHVRRCPAAVVHRHAGHRHRRTRPPAQHEPSRHHAAAVTRRHPHADGTQHVVQLAQAGALCAGL